MAIAIQILQGMILGVVLFLAVGLVHALALLVLDTITDWFEGR